MSFGTHIFIFMQYMHVCGHIHVNIYACLYASVYKTKNQSPKYFSVVLQHIVTDKDSH